MKKNALAVLAVAASAAFAAPAFAIEIPLANGGFDVGTPASNTFGLISQWTAQSVPTSGFQSGVFTSYAGLTSFDGSPRMALLTNQNTLFVQLRNAAPVELFNMPYFNFDLAFLTTDGLGTALANRDQFSVVIDYFSDAAGLNQIGTQSFTINTGTLYALGAAGQPFNTSVNASSPNRLVNGQLGYYVLPITLPSAPYANFTFYLDNLGTGTGTSAVLIDHVFINPEPGTVALFGLGALGLGGLVMRRRAAKKKALAAKA